MNFGFWKQLPRPFTALAPMSGVTDAAFRSMIVKYGKPDVVFTEFVPADGLCSRGRTKLLVDLWKTDEERPIVAQLYGGKPDNYREAATIVADLGYDGIDINMGCPARTVESRYGGSALIRHPELARKIIEETKLGAGNLPVSVKTRIGYYTNEISEWMVCLMDAQPAAITIHARTREEMSKVPARWDVVQHAVEIAHQMQPDDQLRPQILGNGDVKNLAEVAVLSKQYGCDGVMVGRGIYGNPWFFNPCLDKSDLPLDEVLDVMLEHTELHYKLYSGIKPIEHMKKHFKSYVTGFRGAAGLRVKLMEAETFEQLKEIMLTTDIPGEYQHSRINDPSQQS